MLAIQIMDEHEEELQSIYTRALVDSAKRRKASMQNTVEIYGKKIRPENVEYIGTEFSPLTGKHVVKVIYQTDDTVLSGEANLKVPCEDKEHAKQRSREYIQRVNAAGGDLGSISGAGQ